MDKRSDKINLMTMFVNKDIFKATFQYLFFRYVLLGPLGLLWRATTGLLGVWGPYNLSRVSCSDYDPVCHIYSITPEYDHLIIGCAKSSGLGPET